MENHQSSPLICTGCKQSLEPAAFSANVHGGRHDKCRTCRPEMTREWRERNAEYIAAVNARKRAEYAELAGPLERRCEICNTSYTLGRRDSKKCSRECRSNLSYLYRKARRLDEAA